MASNLVKTGAEATNQFTKQFYTIILTTPRSATPTFLYDLQQSTLNPLFIGNDLRFFRKQNPTNWGWSHLLLLQGENVELPKDWQIRQRWSFTVEAEREFAPEEESFCALVKQGSKNAKQTEAKMPEDLADTMQYWTIGKKNRLYVVSLLTFPSPKARETYMSHLSSISNLVQNPLNMQIHLSGPVTQPIPQILEWNDPNYKDSELIDFFTLSSFPSEKDYGAYLTSDEFKKLKDEGVKEGVILSLKFRMPPKSQKIDKMGWQYGNPYEPYGEDWFG